MIKNKQNAEVRYTERELALIAISCIFSSAVVTLKAGIWLFLLHTVVSIALWHYFYQIREFMKKIPEKWWFITLIAGFSALSCAALIIHPKIDTEGFYLFGRFVGPSDADNGLFQTTYDMLHCRYPYYSVSFLGNQHTPMPGALLIAVPFVLLSALLSSNLITLQNVFWSIVLLWTLHRFQFRSLQTTALFALLLVISCPNLVYHVVTGVDYISNSIYVLLSVYAYILSTNSSSSNLAKLFSAGIMGISFSSRLNYVFLLPILFMYTIRKKGFITACLHFFAFVLAFSAITLPFYFYDPAGFSPLHTSSKIKFSFLGFHYWNFLIVGICAAVSLTLAIRVSENSLFHYVFISVALPIFVPTTIAFLESQGSNTGYFHFGILILFFSFLSSKFAEVRSGQNVI